MEGAGRVDGVAGQAEFETGRHRVQLAHFSGPGRLGGLSRWGNGRVVVDEVSQEAVDEQRRELEALLRETRDPG